MKHLNSREQSEKLQDRRSQYIEKQIVPWLVAHLHMRSTGLSVFTAIQGVLIVAYSTKAAFGVLMLGLASALAFVLWDARNRDVFTRLHSLAEEHSDRQVFGVGEDGRANNGLHRQALRTLVGSGSLNPGMSRYSGFWSHTWAVRVVVGACAIYWLTLFVQNYLPRYFG